MQSFAEMRRLRQVNRVLRPIIEAAYSAAAFGRGNIRLSLGPLEGGAVVDLKSGRNAQIYVSLSGNIRFQEPTCLDHRLQ